MGYESRLIIVKKSKFLGVNEEYNKVWAEKIAEVNLCVIGDCVSEFNTYPPTDCYFYDEGVEEAILKDLYDEPLKEIPIKDCIEILERAEKRGHYRRYPIAIGLLKAFSENDWSDGEVVVLHYGY